MISVRQAHGCAGLTRVVTQMTFVTLLDFPEDPRPGYL